ncbi:MAG: choice-of-anchor Q domain-containing protein [Bacteroidota bacterium]
MLNLGTAGGTSSPSLTNCTIARNTATQNGGGVFSNGSSSGTSTPSIVNTIIHGNTASNGAQLANSSASPVISYSLIEGSGGSSNWSAALGTDGGNNIDADPRFEDASDPNGNDNRYGTDDDGLRVFSNSPTLNAGNNAATGLPSVDLRGEARIQFTTVDMGVYEGGLTRIIYVTPLLAKDSNEDGTSWDDAFVRVEDALADGRNGDEIWIAAGTYKPTSGTDRTASFTVTGLQDGLQIYGGFAGTETQRTQRDAGTNPVILSGDLGTLNDASDNSYHVMIFDGGDAVGANVDVPVTAATVLDGVVITGGQADGTGGNAAGGGVYLDGSGSGNAASPTLSNVVFTGNAATVGGGLYSNGSASGASSPVLVNVVFTANTATQDGGAVAFDGSSGGTSSGSITHGTLQGNTAGQDGGGIHTNGTGGTAAPVIVNSILYANTATNGAQVSNDGATPSFQHSLIQGSGGSGSWDTNLGTDGGNNLDADPLFADAADSDGADGRFATADDGLRIQGASPALDGGTASAGQLPSTDITGANRVNNMAPDMGAYEGVRSAQLLYVDRDATGGANNGTSWGDAFTDLQSALALASGLDQIWIAEGTYRPTSGTDRTVSFTITGDQDGLKVYGGFAGTETQLSQRDASTNMVTLSGDIGTANDASDNSYHVVLIDGGDLLGANIAANVTPATVLDGVTVTKGNANGASQDRNGGGIFCDGGTPGDTCSPTLANIRLEGNNATNGGGMYTGGGSPVITQAVISNNTAFFSGAGIYALGLTSGQGSTPFLTDVVFEGNAAGNGGGLYLIGGASSPVCSNCVFSGNTATDGGAIYMLTFSSFSADVVTLTNALFVGNSATDEGGALHIRGGNRRGTNLTFTNCTLFGNTATQRGGGIYTTTVSTGVVSSSLANTILYGNTAGSGNQVEGAGSSTFAFAHVLVEGSGGSANWDANLGTDGGNNLDADPQFANTADPDGGDNQFFTTDDGLRLLAASPAREAGNNAATHVAATDIAGQPRIQDSTVELGAYEFPGVPLPVELTTFEAVVDAESVYLRWSTASETNNAGFYLERQGPSGRTWNEAVFVEGHGTTLVAQHYTHTIATPEAGTHRFRLRQVDLDGAFAYSPEVEVIVEMAQAISVTTVHPNPFTTSAAFTVGVRRTQQVNVGVYDALGRRVVVLHDGSLASEARHPFSISATDGWASGLYFIRVEGEQFIETQSLVLLK